MFFAADSSRDQPDIRRGDFHLCIFASLAKELVVHQDGHVHDLYLFEYVDEWFTDIEDGYLTTSAYGEPFFGKSSCHAAPPYRFELLVLRSGLPRTVIAELAAHVLTLAAVLIEAVFISSIQALLSVTKITRGRDQNAVCECAAPTSSLFFSKLRTWEVWSGGDDALVRQSWR